MYMSAEQSGMCPTGTAIGFVMAEKLLERRMSASSAFWINSARSMKIRGATMRMPVARQLR